MTIRQADRWQRRQGWALRSEGSGSPLAFGTQTNTGQFRERAPGIPGIDDVIDDEIQLVLDNDELDDAQKASIIKQLEAWRTEDKALQERLAERDKQRRVERLTQLIEQANRP